MEAKMLALVLAGGEGTRLRPLTEERPKPAVHVGHGYRIVDFVLGNLVNSGAPWIYVLAQYKPQPLIAHLAEVWAPCQQSSGSTIHTVVPAGEGRFRGTADAVYRNLHLIERHRPDVVAVFAADHIYRMDVRQMAAFHAAMRAEITVAAVPVPLAEAGAFGVIVAAPGGEIRRFDEKPLHPVPIPGDPAHAYASMGNYLFEPKALAALLEECARRGGSDFGHHVLPHLGARRAFAYDFSRNRVPGVQPYEAPAYWRDVGTLEALAAARRDLEGPRPSFDLRNPQWPIRPDRLPQPRAAA